MGRRLAYQTSNCKMHQVCVLCQIVTGMEYTCAQSGQLKYSQVGHRVPYMVNKGVHMDEICWFTK